MPFFGSFRRRNRSARAGNDVFALAPMWPSKTKRPQVAEIDRTRAIRRDGALMKQQRGQTQPVIASCTSAPSNPDGLEPLVQQGPGRPEIGGLKSFLEPTINQCEGIAGLPDPSLFLMQSCQAQGRS